MRNISTRLIAGFLFFVFCLGSGAAQERMDRVVFESGTEGYHTYRIPAMVVSTNGTLLAFCEGRKTSSSDAGDIDLVLKRSSDNGATWGPLILVQEEGGSAGITIGNPAPVVDSATGTIWLPFCRNNDRVFITQSHDDGLTWSNRVEVTATVKDAGWSWYATGPCHGIQLERGAHAGRLLIPCDHRASGLWGSHVIYSDDHGASWQLGGIMDNADGLEPNESVAVELVDSKVYLNARNHGGQQRRVYGISADGGGSFSGPVIDSTLIEPVVQASAVRYAALDQGDAQNLILFSNPATTGSRTRMTVRRSGDETQSWDAGKMIYEGPSAYSDLGVLPDQRIGLLFERGNASAYETITFTRFDLAYLNSPEPPAADPAGAWWKLNEKVAGEAVDLDPGALRDTGPESNALHMTAQHALSYAQGDPHYGRGAALEFSGAQRVQIFDSDTANHLDFDTEDSFTLEAVIRMPAGTAQTGAIVAKDVGGNQPSWWLRVQDGKLRFLVDDGNGHVPNLSSTSDINDGQWHHVAAVRDAALDELRVYIDHGLENTVSDTTDVSSANGNAVCIGAFNSSGRFYTGAIDFVRITPSVLAPEAFVPVTDHDADGLPTDYEEENNLDPDDDGSGVFNHGPQGNPDGDAFTNIQEYIAGTRSDLADSFPRLAGMGVDTNQMLHVSMLTATGRRYRLASRGDLEGGATWDEQALFNGNGLLQDWVLPARTHRLEVLRVSVELAP